MPKSLFKRAEKKKRIFFENRARKGSTNTGFSFLYLMKST